jgi:hypothetical protein
MLLSPAALGAGTRYEGTTSQEQKMNLRTNERGQVTRAFLFWRASCKRGPGFRNSTRFTAPLDRSRRRGFRDRRRYRAEDGELMARYTATIEGVRKTRRKISGTFKLTVHFLDDGERYETCRVRDVDWRVKVPRPERG